MDVAAQILKEVKLINSNANWKQIQGVVKDGFRAGDFCNKRKSWSLKKVAKYIKKKIKNDLETNPKVDNSNRLGNTKDVPVSDSKDSKSVRGKKE